MGVGLLIAMQSRLTADLSERSGSVYLAAVITAGSGLVLLSAYLLVSGHREGMTAMARGLRTKQLPRWALFAGLGGTFFLVTQGLAAGPLGLAVFGMAAVVGQIVGGLVFDSIGLAGAGRTRPTRLRLLGSVLALAAVIGTAIVQGGSGIDLGLAAITFLAGVALAAAAGANGRMQGASGSASASAIVNHAVGFATVVVILSGITLMGTTSLRLPPEPWLYLGGAIGAIAVVMTVRVTRVLGVLLLGLGTVAGQLTGGLLLDLLLPSSERGIHPSTVVGVCLTLFAVFVTYLGTRSRRQPSPAPDSEPHDEHEVANAS